MCAKQGARVRYINLFGPTNESPEPRPCAGHSSRKGCLMARNCLIRCTLRFLPRCAIQNRTPDNSNIPARLPPDKWRETARARQILPSPQTRKVRPTDAAAAAAPTNNIRIMQTNTARQKHRLPYSTALLSDRGYKFKKKHTWMRSKYFIAIFVYYRMSRVSFIEVLISMNFLWDIFSRIYFQLNYWVTSQVNIAKRAKNFVVSKVFYIPIYPWYFGSLLPK